MRSHSDFWFILHKLVGELQQEATTDEERTQQLVDALQAQNLHTRHISEANLEFTVAAIELIYAEMKKRAQSQPQK